MKCNSAPLISSHTRRKSMIPLSCCRQRRRYGSIDFMNLSYTSNLPPKSILGSGYGVTYLLSFLQALSLDQFRGHRTNVVHALPRFHFISSFCILVLRSDSCVSKETKKFRRRGWFAQGTWQLPNDGASSRPHFRVVRCHHLLQIVMKTREKITASIYHTFVYEREWEFFFSF